MEERENGGKGECRKGRKEEREDGEAGTVVFKN